MRALNKLAIATLAAGAATAAWATTVGVHDFRVRYAATRVLAPGANPIRVLHLSDIHLAPWQHRKIEWLRTLADLQPDLIINTGDNVGHSDVLDELRRALAPLAGVPGVYVHGSNDHMAPSPRNPFLYFFGPSNSHKEPTMLDVDSMDALFVDELGWHGLDNTALTLNVVGNRIDFLGLGDAHRGWDDSDALEAARVKLKRRTTKTSTIGVTHAPYTAPLNTLAKDGADALFAGHTHGGQICLPGGRALVTNCDLPVEQARGLSNWDHESRAIPLHVSGGIGTSIYAPARLFCAPEASIVTLLPRVVAS